MAIKKSLDARIKEIVAEVLAMEAEEEGEAWQQETIDDIENRMIRIGDLVAREVGVQALARHMDRPVEDERCPDCGRAGNRMAERRREIITRRGKVATTEAKYHCHKCRRDFFPSDCAIGN